MPNQDILHDLWVRSGCECKRVSLSTIEAFASKNKNKLRSKKGITSSGFDYAVLKFILLYTEPVGWPPGLWEKFELAKDNRTGNYRIWRFYLDVYVNVLLSKNNQDPRQAQNLQGSLIVDKCPHQRLNNDSMVSGGMPSPIPVKNDHIKKSDVFSFNHAIPEMDHYINWIVNTIDEIPTSNSKGWQGLIQSYQWPPGKGSFEDGITYRRVFHFLVNRASGASGIGAKEYQQGICTTIAGWGGIDTTVDEELAINIFSTVQYLQSLGESDYIDPNRICGERIATSSKVYYFSNPQLWTIYDSRLAYALNTLAEKYAEVFPDAETKLSGSIRFSIPVNRKGRKNPALPWSNNIAASSFVRASLLLRSIAFKLNFQKIPPPSQGVISSGSWDLYHVEMALFMLGK